MPSPRIQKEALPTALRMLALGFVTLARTQRLP